MTVGTTPGLPVAQGDFIFCTFSAAHKHRPSFPTRRSSDLAGQTTLNIGTSAAGSQVDTQLTGAAGAAPLTTGADTVDTGNYFVAETADVHTSDPRPGCLNI